MFNLKKAPSLALAALIAAAIPIAPAIQAQAQSLFQGPGQNHNDLTLPESVPLGTKVWIDGDPSLKPATESLSSSFEAQFPDASIHYESQGSDPAVTGVISGRLDVAAIGRGLTSLEERAGVQTLSLSREKIATFVGVENPFRGEISDQQFAQIFRGEITNWSELGGAEVPIRFIDLAATSDTRRSLGSYALFQSAPFESGETAVIQPNNVSSVIENLGNDGIGYALYEQVKDRPDIRILPMHGVMPTDVRYPFSQPRNFAYLGANPTPEAIAFLGYVSETAPTASQSQTVGPQNWTLGHNAKALGNQLTVQSDGSPVSPGQTATAQTATVANSIVENSTASGSQAAAQRNSPNGISYRPSIMDTIHAPWWWLAPLAPLGVIGFAALRRKRLDEAKAAEMGATAASAGLAGAGLTSSVGAAGAGLAGISLAARGRKERNTPAPWDSNSLTHGTIANDDAAGFALGMPQNQTPHHQTVNELDLERPNPAPQGPTKPERVSAKQRPSLQPNKPLERPIKKPFDGKTVSSSNSVRGRQSAPAESPAVDFPSQVKSPQSAPNFGTIAGAGLAAAGLAGAGMAASQSSGESSSSDALASPEPVNPDLQGTDDLVQEQLAAKHQAPESLEPNDGPEENRDRLAQEQPTPVRDNVRHLSERRRRELVDQSIDKALERPNGGKKGMPSQEQPLQGIEMQYGNPKPDTHPKPDQQPSETAATSEPVSPASWENPATARNQNKLSAEDSTALGNALKRAGLGAAGVAGAAGLASNQSAAQPPAETPVAETPVAMGPASRLDAPMAGPGNSDNEQTWITLTPHNSHQGEVNWHISEEHRLEAKRRGGQRMMIRINDADPSTQPTQWLPSSYTYECRNRDRKQVDLPAPNRDYVAELGFFTAEEEWIHIARSVHSHSPTAEYDGCRIVIMPCDPHRQMREGPTRNPKPQAYVYWDIAPEFKRRLRKQGGQMLALRIYDADHINLDQQHPHHTDEYMLDENARDKVVTVPTAEHDYVAEIGYLTIDGNFLSLGRSVFAHIPVAVAQQ